LGEGSGLQLLLEDSIQTSALLLLEGNRLTQLVSPHRWSKNTFSHPLAITMVCRKLTLRGLGIVPNQLYLELLLHNPSYKYI
jgi:hypothetical protein